MEIGYANLFKLFSVIIMVGGYSGYCYFEAFLCTMQDEVKESSWESVFTHVFENQPGLLVWTEAQK